MNPVNPVAFRVQCISSFKSALNTKKATRSFFKLFLDLFKKAVRRAVCCRPMVPYEYILFIGNCNNNIEKKSCQGQFTPFYGDSLDHPFSKPIIYKEAS